ncbi:MAG: hypothetical protein ACYSOQ_04755, partial [Planctomycetota bacterium]
MARSLSIKRFRPQEIFAGSAGCAHALYLILQGAGLFAGRNPVVILRNLVSDFSIQKKLIPPCSANPQ